ncbi:MAG: phosphatase PAP2 family protein [Oscillospiraceae bacterium]|nr:phosphatase PAP2 family protein [Oscillospiraceae bacterium]
MLSWPKRIFAVLAGLGLAAAGLWAGFLWDLSITRYLYDPVSPFALWAEAAGWWPLYMPLGLLGFVLAASCKKNVRTLKGGFAFAGSLLFLLLGLAVLILPACHYLEKRAVPFTGGVMPFLFVGAAFFIAVLLALFCRIKPGNLVRLRAYALLGVGFIILENIAVNLMKWIWQRARFDDMLQTGSFDAFTSWLSAPGSGGSSFPSGHTAAASALILCVFFVILFPSCKKEGEKLLFTGYIYALAVGFGRMMMGRHFLSDTIAAILVVTALTVLLWALPPVRKALKKAAQRARQLDGPPPPDPGRENAAPPAGEET